MDILLRPSAQKMSSFRLAFLFLALHSFIAPAIGQRDRNFEACQSVSAVRSYCVSASPGWSSYTAFSSQAPCLCYESATWKPQIYDGIVSSCYNYFITADPTYISSLSVSRARDGDGTTLPTAPCSRAGDFVAGVSLSALASTPRITAGPSAALSRYDINRVACGSIDRIGSFCESVTPGFSSLSFSRQAGCLCYSGISWDPAPYDSIFGSCANYLSTADTKFYSTLKAEGFVSTPCKDLGDVLTETTGSAKRTILVNSQLPNTPNTFSLDNTDQTSTAGARAASSTSSPATTAKKGSSSSALPTASPTKNGVGSGIEVCSHIPCIAAICENTNTLPLASQTLPPHGSGVGNFRSRLFMKPRTV